VCEKAERLSQDLFKCRYFETSAKDDKNVQDCFSKIIELINETEHRESLSQINSNRSKSTMSLFRRISIFTSPMRNVLVRPSVEPSVKNNEKMKK
jgi:hypothetical protein